MSVKLRKSFRVIGVVSFFAIMLASSRALAAPQFKWANGSVSTFTFQSGNFNVVGIKSATDTKFVRFCDPTAGRDIALTANQVQYDLLKTAYMKGRSVQVGVYDFGKDPQSGSEKLCIDRVILNP